MRGRFSTISGLFKICREINQCDGSVSGSCLASSLTENARSLLTKLNSCKRKSFRVLVKKLAERHGSFKQNRVVAHSTSIT